VDVRDAEEVKMAGEPVFSVLILTATPAGLPVESGGIAGGAGPFIKIDGREALLRSVELFLNRDNVKQIQLVFLPEDAEEGKRKYGAHLGFSGVKLVTGGPRWVDQIAAGAGKLSAEATHVIVHDAARPAVPYSDVDALMEAAPKHAATALVTPLRGGLAELDEGGGAMAFHAASRYRQVLTPQVFSAAAFKEMAGKKAEPHASQFGLVEGSGLNVRASGGRDASLLKAMLNMLPKRKVRGPENPFEEAQW
jgi:2-C-methyl-D-erythritol 4-phosphate cytidylyltransferase